VTVSTLLKPLLFAVLLLLAQAGALTHAAEHLRLDAAIPGDPACTVCMAAQGLDAPLLSAATDLPFSAADFSPVPAVVAPAFAPPAVSPRARAPPIA
jgi:hypothetical protein